MFRSAVMVLFEWELPKTPEREFPDLSAEAVGHCVCGVLSALYGKRFDCHGLRTTTRREGGPSSGCTRRGTTQCGAGASPGAGIRGRVSRDGGAGRRPEGAAVRELRGRFGRMADRLLGCPETRIKKGVRQANSGVDSRCKSGGKEGVTSHFCREPCVGSREGMGEASVAVRVGRANERRNR